MITRSKAKATVTPKRVRRSKSVAATPASARRYSNRNDKKDATDKKKNELENTERIKKMVTTPASAVRRSNRIEKNNDIDKKVNKLQNKERSKSVATTPVSVRRHSSRNDKKDDIDKKTNELQNKERSKSVAATPASARRRSNRIEKNNDIDKKVNKLQNKERSKKIVTTPASVRRHSSRNDKKDDIDKKTNELEIKGEDEEDVFGVDYIVEHRKASEINFVEWNQAWNGSMDELAFLVKWTGFDSTENTWEPLENVLTCVKFEQYLNKFLVPTIGRTLRKGRGRRENVSFEFIEPKVNQCYYLKDLQVSNVNCVGHDDSDVHDHDFVPTPPPKKAKYSAIRSPKVVAKPKKTKQDVESNAASYALHNLLNGENFVFDEGNAVSENIVADETADFFGGAPDVDDLLTEPHVFEADVILGNFDTPVISKKKKQFAPPPKKRGRPTKNVPQPTTRVTRSRTFAASSTAPENDAIVVNTNSLGSYSNDQQQTYPVPLQNDFDYSFNNNIIPPSTSSKIDPNPRTSFSNDPMLMGNYEDLYSDNRYVPPISDGFKNVEENEKQNFDGNFLASENLEEDLSIHFNFNGSSSNNAGFNSIMNPYYQQQNITNETELFDLETTYDNPFNLFGFENASALLEPSIGYIEDFMDVVQEDII